MTKSPQAKAKSPGASQAGPKMKSDIFDNTSTQYILLKPIVVSKREKTHENTDLQKTPQRRFIWKSRPVKQLKTPTTHQQRTTYDAPTHPGSLARSRRGVPAAGSQALRPPSPEAARSAIDADGCCVERFPHEAEMLRRSEGDQRS